MSKSRIKTVVKLLIGAILIGYVLHSKMIDFKDLKDSLLHPKNILAAFLFLSICSIMTGTRWFLLVRAQGLTLSFPSILQLTLIGQFFNTFMPGAVGGDLIKAWYVAGCEPKRKTKAIFTVLLDRVMGLSVFFFFAAVALFFYIPFLDGRIEMRTLAHSLWSLALGGTIFTALCFTPFFHGIKPLQKLVLILRRNQMFHKVLEATLLYRNHLIQILICLVLSFGSVTSLVFFAKVQGDSLEIPLSLLQYFFIIPIALTVSAIPILPGGIGVGQVAYFTLFEWMKMDNPAQGGTLCTVLQIYTILFNFIGGIFYIKYKRKPEKLPAVDPLNVPASSTANP